MNVTLDIKTLLAIAAVIATMGGFYFSTQFRLDSLEARIELIQDDVAAQVEEIHKLRHRIKKR